MYIFTKVLSPCYTGIIFLNFILINLFNFNVYCFLLTLNVSFNIQGTAPNGNKIQRYEIGIGILFLVFFLYLILQDHILEYY